MRSLRKRLLASQRIMPCRCCLHSPIHPFLHIGRPRQPEVFSQANQSTQRVMRLWISAVEIMGYPGRAQRPAFDTAQNADPEKSEQCRPAWGGEIVRLAAPTDSRTAVEPRPNS